MKLISRWIIVLLAVAALQLSACSPASPAKEKVQPAKVEKVEGSDLKRVTLTEKAAERLGIQTVLVSDQPVARTWVVGGEVVAPTIASDVIKAPISGIVLASPDAVVPVAGTQLGAGQIVLRLSPAVASSEGGAFVDVGVPSKSALLRMLVTPGQTVEAGQALFEVIDLNEAWVRVSLNESDLGSVDRNQPAYISSLDANDAEDDEEEDFEANALDDIGDDDPGEERATVYYIINNPSSGMAAGQRVLVELTLSGSGATRQVVPYAAIIYDLQGNTWVYINPEPLVFIRHPVTVDYIADDMVVLLEGPPTGTAVVTVGVAELFGAETGVSK